MTQYSSERIGWGECYYDHFEKYLGQPADRQRFQQNHTAPMLQIINYDNIFGGCRAFCSFGLSRYVEEIGEVAEVFMPVDDGWDDTPRILANVLFFMIQQRMKIGWGLTIRFAETHPNFVTEFGKSAIYFSIPFGMSEDFNQVICDSQIGEVYLACYISEAERQFFLDRGAYQFELLLGEHNVDIFNIGRESII